MRGVSVDPTAAEALAHRLKAARKKAGLSQEQAAEVLGIQRSAVCDMEGSARGRHLLALELADLSRLYGVSVDELLGAPSEMADVTVRGDEGPTRYTVDVTEAQARAIADALDFYVRVVGLCQLDQVAWQHRAHMDISTEDGRERAAILSQCMDDAALHAFGFDMGASRGIHHPDVPAECRTMYDLRRVLRHALAERRVAELEALGDTAGASWVRGTVDLHRVVPVGDGPMAEVAVKEGEG